MLNCEQVADDLMALLDGELAGFQVEAVHGHFKACPRCARFYQSLREQLVLHQWSADGHFDLDDADACHPDDVPDYGALAARLRHADVGDVGRALYEILKAEFLSDYGDDLEASEAPIDDPGGARARSAELVEELRDWHDADEVDGVDLADMARRVQRPAEDRLEALFEGMGVVAGAHPDLRHAARYYQAVARLKQGQRRPAEVLFQAIVADASAPLARLARVSLATLPVMYGDPPEVVIDALEGCLTGDATDALVHYNLAKAHFQAGHRASAGMTHLTAARGLDPGLVERQVSRPGEQAFREWIAAQGG